MVQRREAAQARLAQQRHMDAERQRAQAGIGADVRGRPLAADVLLAGRQRQHPGAAAVGVDGLAAQAARHLAHEIGPGGEQADIGAAEVEADAEALAFAGDDVGAHVTGGFQCPERYRLGDDDHQQRPGFVAFLCQVGGVVQIAEKVRRLHDDAGGVGGDVRCEVFAAGDVGRREIEAEPEELGLGPHRFAVVGMQRPGQDRAVAAGQALGHQHRFGGGGRAFVHRRVGDLHAGQHRHLGLELEQELERALADFRLVRRVGGQELAALDQVIDRRRNMMAIGPAAQERRPRPGRAILCRHRRHRPLDFELALVIRQIQQAVDAGGGRDVAEQFVDRRRADHAQHVAAVVAGERQIAHQAASSA